MKPKLLATSVLITCFLISFSQIGSASASPEVYVGAGTTTGSANLMVSNGDGTFASQEIIHIVSGPTSYGNGIGDFDNDGDYDYVMGSGVTSGAVYLYEKSGPGNQFYEPITIDTWNNGSKYAGDIAVADFNEDGNLDFVLTHMVGASCDLFAGDGQLGFEHSVIGGKAPLIASGADAADFNNDKHADFIVAPVTGSYPFYLNFGDGKGGFTTYKLPTHDGAGYYGVAAADFNNDGNVDIVAIRTGSMDIYQGFGDGSFEWIGSFEDENFLTPGIDNYDFDGDGNQDLVIGNYLQPDLLYSAYGVAVFMGNGKFEFDFKWIDTGGSSGNRRAVSAPPLSSNEKPTAVAFLSEVSVTAGDEIEFDGLDSYDADGSIVEYTWDFGDGDIGYDALDYHSYSAAGSYTVTLTVTDNQGATNSYQTQVDVKALPAIVRITPRRLNLKSKGKWMHATIELPADYNVAQVEASGLSLSDRKSTVLVPLADARYGYAATLFKHKKGKAKTLKIKFDRQAVIDAIQNPSEETVLVIWGSVYRNGNFVQFSGSDTIRIIQHDHKKKGGDFTKGHK